MEESLDAADSGDLSTDSGSSQSDGFEDDMDEDSALYDEYEIEKRIRLLGSSDRNKLQLRCPHADSQMGECLPKAASDGKEDMVRSYINNGVSIDFVNEFGNSALLLASHYNHIGIVRYLIDSGADRNKCGNLSQTKQSVLHAAAMSGNTDIVEYLAEHSSLLDAKDGVGNTPLHLAARRGHYSTVLVLIASGANFNTQNAFGQNCLYGAVEKRHRKIIDVLMTNGVEISLSDINGNTLLHKAKDSVTTENLHLKGADLNFRNNKGETPLLLAVRLQQFKKIKTLLKRGADPNIPDDTNSYPLHEAACLDIQIVSALLRAGAGLDFKDDVGMTPFLYAAVESKTDISHLLWKRGADINSQSSLGYTAVHQICWNLTIEGIEPLVELLKTGCEVDIPDHAGITPLMIAVLMAPPEAIPVLIEAGANTNQRENFGRTPLMASIDRPDIVRCLLLHGPEVTIQDKAGFSVLHHCAECNCVETAKLVIEHNPELLKLKDNHMQTPLHAASSTGSTDMVKYLIGCGVSVNDTDKYGCTPLHYAAYSGHEDAFSLLIKAGGDANIADTSEETAIACANRRRHIIDKNNGDEMQFESLSNRYMDERRSVFVQGEDELCLDKNKIIELNATNETAKETENSEYIKVVLRTFGIGTVTFNTDESVLIRETFRKLIKSISDKIYEKDYRFRNEIIFAGSVSEGTKVGDPDEFDVMFVLEEFSDLCLPPNIDDRENTIFVPLRSSSRHMDIPESYRDFFKNGVLLRSKLFDAFAYLLLAVVNSAEFQWPGNVRPCQFWNRGQSDCRQTTVLHTFMWRGQEFKSLEVSVDMVPAIHVNAWPSDVADHLITDAMRASGYHLVAKPFTKKSQDYMISSVTYPLNENQWRISFAVAERMIFESINDRLKDSYRVAKAIRNKEICPKLLLTSSGMRAVAVECQHIIPTYFIKICLFNLLLNGKFGDTNKESVTKNGVMRIFESMEEAFSKNYLPFTFMPSYNLLKDCFHIKTELQEIMPSYCRMLRSISAT